MQSDQLSYDPALDDGGGGLGAVPQGYSPWELGDPNYADSFELFIPDYSALQHPELLSVLPRIPSRNPIPSLVPLNGHALENLTETAFPAYRYLRSSSSSSTQENTSHGICPSNDNYYSRSTCVPGHLDGVPNVPMYQQQYPVGQSLSTGQSGLNGDSQWAALAPSTGHNYPKHTSVSPLRDKSFEGFHDGLPGGSEPYQPPIRNHVDYLQVHNAHDSTFTPVQRSYPASQQPTLGRFVTASSPNTAMLAHSNTHGFQPQGNPLDFAMASPGSQAHQTSYAAPPHLPRDYNPFAFTGERPFDSSLPHNHPAHDQESQLRFKNLTSRDTFDSVGVGTMLQIPHLYGDAGRTPSISDLSMSPLEPHHHALTTWLGLTPHQQTDPMDSGFPTTVNQCDESPPQTLPFSPEAFGYASQAGRTDSSDGASPSSPIAASHIGAPIPITRQPDTPKYGGLNPFLSLPASRNKVPTRSTHYRAKVLNLDDVPPNLRPYYWNHHRIPLPEYDTLFATNRDGEFCIKCGYDVTYRRRRKGLKYEHANVHLNNRPFHCLDCGKRYCRPTAHPKNDHHIRLPPSHN